jgi:hypothetical protein
MAEQPPNKIPQFPCKHLRSHEMNFEDSPLKPEDEYSSGIYHCEQTHDALGPDGEIVDREECTPDRDCFEELGT